MPRPSVLLCAIICAVVLSTACSAPPQKEIDRAQQAIDAARTAGAERYAAEAYATATAALQQSHEAVGQRDYRLALSLAVDASDRAQEAERAAAENKARARGASEAAVNTANAALMQLQARLKVAEQARVLPRELAPAQGTARDAEAILQKARTLLSSGDYSAATAAVSGLDEQIRSENRVVEAATTLRIARRPARKR